MKRYFYTRETMLKFEFVFAFFSKTEAEAYCQQKWSRDCQKRKTLQITKDQLLNGSVGTLKVFMYNRLTPDRAGVYENV